MNYYEKNGSVYVEDCPCFNLKDTLESGQCFRFFYAGHETYMVMAGKLAVKIRQLKSQVIFACTLEEFESFWLCYFDLKRDYNKIAKRLSETDPVMKAAIDYAPGIRILKQDTFECLVSFIISQNKHIPAIKAVIEKLCESAGVYITKVDEKKIYSFPECARILSGGHEMLRACGAGFRDKYIVDACKKIKSGEINMESLDDKATAQLREALMSIYGVGRKVADCTMLFSFGRHEVFPVDVWVKRVMETLYFDGKETGLNEIQDFANCRYGNYAGFAQQYLFHYARTLNIGKNK